jgi:hypothetical protein
MGDEMYPSKPSHGTLSHPWPGSPLHQRAEALVPGPMLPKTERTVRQLPASVVTWLLGWKLQCWMYASLQSSRCETEPSTGIVRHLPGEATFSSCRPFRFQRWKSEPLQGLITTGMSPLGLGASRQKSPNRLLIWTGPSALAAPALSVATPNTVLTTTTARPTPPINRNSCMVSSISFSSTTRGAVVPIPTRPPTNCRRYRISYPSVDPPHRHRPASDGTARCTGLAPGRTGWMRFRLRRGRGGVVSVEG